ncbi:MAG: hypothetical protein HY040_25560 [Planctomycetes bacterium]|nr:hypothetical protein [Planctomycetota bacterium]
MLGLIAGSVIGSLTQCLAWLNIDADGQPYFPVYGIAFGAAAGLLLSPALQHVRITGRSRSIILGILCGFAGGFAFAWVIGSLLPASEEKEREFNAATLGLVGGGTSAVFGGIIGWRRKLIEPEV